MPTPNLNYLLGLEPIEIINWYESKGYEISWNWEDVWQDAHSRSFTVAKILKLDLLQTIRDRWIESQKKGLTFVEFQRRLEGYLKTEGWWGKQRIQDVPGYYDLSEEDRLALGDPERLVQLGSPHRLKTIYNTNANVGYNANRYLSQIANKESRPYLQYKQIEREGFNHDHSHFADLVFHINDPIWDIIYPPNWFNCGCYTRALTKEELDSEGLKVSDGNNYKELALSLIPESWRYNPGKSVFTPNKKEYDRDLFRVFKQQMRIQRS
jgi:uncharacterized protein with gpF-like domain